MEDVSYLGESFYKQGNRELWRDSIEIENRAGEKVRTNRFWMLFKHQFEGWAGLMSKRLGSQVFSLSPSGLALKNAAFMDLDRASRELEAGTRASLRNALSTDEMPRITNQELADLLKPWVGRVETSMRDLDEVLSAASVEKKVGLLRKASDFRDLYQGVLLPLFEFFDRAPEKIQSPDVDKFVLDLRLALEQGRDRNAEFLNRLTRSQAVFFKV
jgi:hypothetical protein